MPPRSPAGRTRTPRAEPRGPAADAALLGRVGYFRSLPAGELAALARRAVSRTLRRGETLFEEGAPAGGLFVLGSGRVEVRQVSRRGREQVFHTEGPGATLGEGPLFDGGGYIASAVALEPTRALFLPRTEVLALCRRHPAVALAMLEALARRVRRFAGIVGDLAFRPVRERLARYLVANAVPRARSTALELDLSLTHAQLAARLGTVRELVARALADLERDGVIARSGRRVIVRDPARLEALAEGE
ncbi:MAG TPA: Crp/Fnr family transcriptional regulator [Methylomirabilota bacterium]|nr:Crp/Fnr family transcriptional regulator [Methylomirabilota bacterium]